MNLSGLPLFADPGSWLWWAGAGVLLVVELTSGTFYLLMIALGFVAAGLARLAGVAGTGQVVVAALLAASAMLALRGWRRRRRAPGDRGRDPDPYPAAANSVAPDDAASAHAALNLDVGAPVYVAHWENGRARARYRGADWDATLADGLAETTGWHRILRIDGIRLVLER